MTRGALGFLVLGLLTGGCGSLNFPAELERASITLPNRVPEGNDKGRTARVEVSAAKVEFSANDDSPKITFSTDENERREFEIALKDQYPHYLATARQLKTGGPGPLSKDLIENPAIVAYLSGLSKSIRVELSDGRLVPIDAGLPEPTLWPWDLKHVTMSMSTIWTSKALADRSRTLGATPDAQTVTFWKAFSGYMSAYTTGQFVDSTGATISKPVFNNGIGNDTVTSAESVLLELLADWFLQTPAFKDEKGNFLTAGGHRPTGADPSIALVPVETVSNNPGGMTTKKVKALQCVSGLAGDGGLALSGAIFKTAGGANAGPILVLGKFSFGDNKTVSRVLETLFEIGFRRGTAELIYKAVRNPATTRLTIKDPDYSCLLDLVKP
jgi:hypothetical protein